MRRRWRSSGVWAWAWAAVLGGLAAGCGARDAEETLARLEREARSQEVAQAREEAPAAPDGSLSGWLALALRQSHEVRASFEQWRAATLQIAPAGTLPEPTLTYAYFVRSVETRVGPQRHRLGIAQMIPWPTRLQEAQRGRAAQAEALQSEFEASALEVQQQVAEAYWEAWRLEAARRLREQQRPVLEALAEQARGRVEVGRGSLAEVSRIELTRGRLEDSLAGLASARRSAGARLLGVTGAPQGWSEAPVQAEEPGVWLPAEGLEALQASAAQHPRVVRFAHQARRARAAEGAAAARRYPSLMVGLDWIETGEADAGLSHTGTVPADSGKDPVIAMLSVSLPIWTESYAGEAEAARREQAAAVERRLAATDRAAAEVRAIWEGLEDSARRVRRYDAALLPQAEQTFEAVVGAWGAAQAPLGDVLASLRELIEVRVERAGALAEHQRLWARLEGVVGRAVAREEVR